MKRTWLCLLVLGVGCFRPAQAQLPPEPSPMPADYYAEPLNLPFDEKTVAEGKETGWSWRAFHYTSLIYNGQPMRIHAVYALPDGTSAQNRVPAVVMTHGKFGQIISEARADPRYWAAVSDLAKAGYATMYFEWNPDPASKWQPTKPDAPQHFSTFGTLDYSKEWRLEGNDWKDSLYYQAIIAGRRAVSWLSARPEVDNSRIGATGASFGGIFSSLLASVEPRIMAVAPTVYNAGFGPTEPAYNHLSRTWTTEQVQGFRSRFDSEWLLKKRSIPVLYTLGTNDEAFSVLKGMRTFQAMPADKHLVLNPNQGHGFWNFPQTIRFFDGVLKGKEKRPTVGQLEIQKRDDSITATVNSSTSKVEFFYALEPVVDTTQPPNPANLIGKWKWIAITATRGQNANYEVQIPLTPEQKSANQKLYVFARATSESGVEECTPIGIVALR